MKMVIGLGNPGEKYAKNRHNTGYIILEEMASAQGLVWEKSPKLKSEICKTQDTLFLKPLTFMNNSGDAVSLAKQYFNVELSDIFVIHDDVDLAFGQVKTQIGAGHAGHRGVMSIMDVLGTKDFNRIRVGIGRPDADSSVPVDEFVLRDFGSEELEKIRDLATKLL